MNKELLERFAQTIENQVRYEISMDRVIEKQNEVIKASQELIEKMDQQNKLFSEIAELNRILDEHDKNTKENISDSKIKTEINDKHKTLQILGKSLFTNAKNKYRKNVGYSFFHEVFENNFYDALVDGRIKECKYLFDISHPDAKNNNQLKLINFVEDQLNEIIEINY